MQTVAVLFARTAVVRFTRLQQIQGDIDILGEAPSHLCNVLIGVCLYFLLQNNYFINISVANKSVKV